MPAVLALVVSGIWAWISLEALEGSGGPPSWQVLLVAVILFALITWRARAWALRRELGSSFAGLLGRGLWEGALTGALIGAGGYGLAALQDGTPVMDIFVAGVLVMWAILGAVAFFIFSLIIGLVFHPTS